MIFHSGVSGFPGSQTSCGNPELLEAIDYCRDLQFVFAHGGCGWWASATYVLQKDSRNVIKM